MKTFSFDKPLLLSIILLTVGGFFIFSSASLGLLARGSVEYSDVAFTQTFYGLFLGAIAFLLFSRIKLAFFRKISLPLFLFSLILTCLVFVPGLGYEHGGAHRWLALGPFSFQPSELLKLSTILLLASVFSNYKNNISTFLNGCAPFLLIIGLVGAVLLLQPDTDTFIVVFMSGLAMFFASGAKKRYIALILLLAAFCAVFLVYTRPYVMKRITTFINPTEDTLGASYQVKQSLIAIGSGGFLGRGFGQSIQKYNFLPEPIGDSIFAVAAEEFGFVGSAVIILTFVFFGYRGILVATRSKDSFGGLLALGIVILILSQAGINIASMLGVFPLSGIPLPFVSHGGTALLTVLAEAGLLLNISRHKEKT
jgi:cell division protein FtsW